MKLTVDPADLRAAAGKFSEYSQNYTQIYQRLLNTAGTMGAAWDNDDNKAFVERINGFCDELKAMVARLDTASQTLNAIAKGYEDTTTENIQVINRQAN